MKGNDLYLLITHIKQPTRKISRPSIPPTCNLHTLRQPNTQIALAAKTECQ